MAQYQYPVDGDKYVHCTISVYYPNEWTPTHHLLSRPADEPDFHVGDEHQMFS